MKKITIYDPPMCCSTGVCGPEVDPRLAQFAGWLEEAKNQGWEVHRYNLSQEPIPFLQNEKVKQGLETNGVESLPMIFLNDDLKMASGYPTEPEWLEWLGLSR